MYHESDHTVDAAKKEINAGLLELLERCSYLYNEAFYANTKLAILRELSKASSDYENEVICAGCFFSFTQLALTESCFMNCARLFDAKSDVSIGNLIEASSLILLKSTHLQSPYLMIDQTLTGLIQSFIHWQRTRSVSTPKKLSHNAQMKSCSEIITEWLLCV